jgi:hypothetical protein
MALTIKMSQDSSVNIVNGWYLIFAKSGNIFLISIVASTPNPNSVNLSIKREVGALCPRIKLP